jgi:NodT family efflux transporter outer membrane factor (OMF) lipoprotein
VFGDAALNEIMAQALDHNFSVMAAWERLQAARATLRRQRADGRVQLNGQAAFRAEDDSVSGSSEQYSAGFQASYELDLWGAIQSETAAEQMRVAASEQAYQTALLSISAEIVLTWYQLAEAQAQASLVQEQIETNEKVLSLQKARFASGLIRSADVLRQSQLLEATREQAIVIESRVRTLRNLLYTLQGEAPQNGDGMKLVSLPDLPPLPDLGVPIERVERRPDVQQAYFQLAAVDMDLATAMTAQYPRIYLSASWESAATDPSDLFSDWLGAIVGELVGPIFTSGRIKAGISRAEAQRNERIALYQQSVLEAFREVEDALVQEQQQHKRVASIQKQMMLARETYEQLREQYANGVTDYIAVLAALADQQEAERDLLSAHLQLIAYRIALYRAIAGSVEEPEHEPKPTAEGDMQDV